MASTIRAWSARRRSGSRRLVGHVVGEGVLEGVLEVGNEPGLVEELRGLQGGRARRAARPPASSAMARSSGEGHVLADHRRRPGAVALPRAAAGRCGRPGRPRPSPAPRSCRSVGPGECAPRSPPRASVSTSVCTVSSRKNGFPSVRSMRSAVSRSSPGSSPRSVWRSSWALSGGNGSRRSWRVGRLAAPGVLILGTIVDQEAEPGRREALDEAVEERLRLGVDPVEVLDHEEQGLDLRLAEPEPLDRVEGALAPLGWIEGLPGAVVHGHVEQGEERGEARPQRRVEREKPARHLLANLSAGRRGPRCGSTP